MLPDLPLRSILLVVLLGTVGAVVNPRLLIGLVAVRFVQAGGVKVGAGDVEDVPDLGGVRAHVIQIQQYLNRMINIKLLQEYLGSLHSKNPGVVNNIFLANSQNHILLSTRERHSESSILSTFLNDSLYIIRLNLAQEEDRNMLELITETDNQYTIIYNIQNLFIYGLSIRKDKLHQGRLIASQSLQQIKQHFGDVIDWAERETP